MKPRVRAAIQADANDIAFIHVIAWKKAYFNYLPSSILDNLTISKRQEQWQQWLQHNNQVLVIEDENKIQGFICLGHLDSDQANIIEIKALYINPEKWRSGFGTLLLEKAINIITNAGYNKFYGF